MPAQTRIIHYYVCLGAAGGKEWKVNIIENTFKGPIHYQLREALQFVKNSIVSKKVVKSADKAESDWVFNYQYAALEEALANAVYHRAYDIREPIEVRVKKYD